MSLPILSIDSAPADAQILMPMRRDIASKIAERLSNTHRGLVIPPLPDNIDTPKNET
jgi:hypothetical protein